MAGAKKPYNELSRSAKYYRDNPDARKKKAQTDKKVNARPEQRKKRSELTTERRKRGIAGKGGGDLSHTSKGLVRKSVSANRGSKSDSAGDRRARGGKSKK
jgi:hypothetical protein